MQRSRRRHGILIMHVTKLWIAISNDPPIWLASGSSHESFDPNGINWNFRANLEANCLELSDGRWARGEIVLLYQFEIANFKGPFLNLNCCVLLVSKLLKIKLSSALIKQQATCYRVFGRKPFLPARCVCLSWPARQETWEVRLKLERLASKSVGPTLLDLTPLP